MLQGTIETPKKATRSKSAKKAWRTRRQNAARKAATRKTLRADKGKKRAKSPVKTFNDWIAGLEAVGVKPKISTAGNRVKVTIERKVIR